MKKIFSIIILTSFFSFSQTKYEFFGTLKLNGKNNTLISYRIVFSETSGKIKGYSVTDLSGNYETKNEISGTYNSKTKELKFKEEDILYTKSELKEEVFCFVNFSGKYNLSKLDAKLEGAFKGFYKNKTKCIDGTLILVGSKKIEKKINKYTNKVQKSKLFSKEVKEKVKQSSILDSLKVNTLTKDQNLNVFVNSNEIQVEIWDAKIEDGDKIDVFLNGRRIIDNYTVTNKKKVFTFKLNDEKNVFRIEAINEGERKLNTAMMQLIDKDRTFELTTNLKKGEKTSITVVKK